MVSEQANVDTTKSCSTTLRRHLRCNPRSPPPALRPPPQFVPVGGGGLMSGVASVLRGAVGRGGARVRLVGCEPAASDAMQRAVRGEAPLREYSVRG